MHKWFRRSLTTVAVTFASLGAVQFFESGSASAYGPGGGSTTTVASGSTTTLPGSTTTLPGSTTTLPGSTTTTVTCSIAISLSGDFVAGGYVTVTISASPNSNYLVTLHSPGSVLGTITTDARGAGSGTYSLPANTVPGMHTIVVQGSCATNSAEFTVDPRLAAATGVGAGNGTGAGAGTAPPSAGAGGAGTAPAAVATAASSSSGSLPFTGADIAILAAIAAAAICAGGMLVLAARRRRRQVRHLRPVPSP